MLDTKKQKTKKNVYICIPSIMQTVKIIIISRNTWTHNDLPQSLTKIATCECTMKIKEYIFAIIEWPQSGVKEKENETHKKRKKKKKLS